MHDSATLPAGWALFEMPLRVAADCTDLQDLQPINQLINEFILSIFGTHVMFYTLSRRRETEVCNALASQQVWAHIDEEKGQVWKKSRHPTKLEPWKQNC